jgi:heme O synthase-like polyprenyltransferase
MISLSVLREYAVCIYTVYTVTSGAQVNANRLTCWVLVLSAVKVELLSTDKYIYQVCCHKYPVLPDL